MRNYKEILSDIKGFVFDVDGVMTDGRVYTDHEGRQHRSTLVKDGYAIALALKKGYPIWVISGGNEPGVRKRLEYLGVPEVHLGVRNKLKCLNQLLEQHELRAEELAYMGDDIPDAEAMQACGLATCPSDAAHEIKTIAQYISPIAGGQGCVRDLISQVMKVNQDWPTL